MDTKRVFFARFFLVATIIVSITFLDSPGNALPRGTPYDVKRNLHPRNGPSGRRQRNASASRIDYDPSGASDTFYEGPPLCNDCVCGISNRRMRIVGGNITDTNEFPWIASMSKRSKFYCAGSLVTRRHILTAAHCLEGFNHKDIRIVLGDHDRSDRSETVVRRRVKTAHIHENFDAYTFNNDIALIELDLPVKFDSVVRPACLPGHRGIDYAGAMAIAAGWGKTGERENVSDSLRKVNLPILSDEECRMTKYDKKRITPNMFCAGYLEGKQDACQGDSGGPLHVTRSNGHLEVVGIISWGRGCARPLLPGIFTKVTNYFGWLRDHIDGECVCPPPSNSVISGTPGRNY